MHLHYWCHIKQYFTRQWTWNICWMTTHVETFWLFSVTTYVKRNKCNFSVAINIWLEPVCHVVSVMVLQLYLNHVTPVSIWHAHTHTHTSVHSHTHTVCVHSGHTAISTALLIMWHKTENKQCRVSSNDCIRQHSTAAVVARLNRYWIVYCLFDSLLFMGDNNHKYGSLLGDAVLEHIWQLQRLNHLSNPTN